MFEESARIARRDSDSDIESVDGSRGDPDPDFTGCGFRDFEVLMAGLGASVAHCVCPHDRDLPCGPDPGSGLALCVSCVGVAKVP